MRLGSWVPYGLSVLVHIGLLGFNWPAPTPHFVELSSIDTEILVQKADPKVTQPKQPPTTPEVRQEPKQTAIAPKKIKKEPAKIALLKKPAVKVLAIKKTEDQKITKAEVQREAVGKAVLSLKQRLNDAGYKARLRLAIESKWKAPMMERPYQLTFHCTIRADGRIQGLEMKESSGFDLLDQAAKRAIIASAPFTAPPKELLGEKQVYEAWFRFRPEESR